MTVFTAADEMVIDSLSLEYLINLEKDIKERVKKSLSFEKAKTTNLKFHNSRTVIKTDGRVIFVIYYDFDYAPPHDIFGSRGKRYEELLCVLTTQTKLTFEEKSIIKKGIK